MERTKQLTIIARTVHEAIRAYQAALGEEVAPEWDHAGWMQAATLEGVEFALENPTSGAQHEAWAASRFRSGWVQGPEKDEALKTHPSLVPFAQLSEAEQRKDAIVIAVVQGMARALGVGA